MRRAESKVGEFEDIIRLNQLVYRGSNTMTERDLGGQFDKRFSKILMEEPSGAHLAVIGFDAEFDVLYGVSFGDNNTTLEQILPSAESWVLDGYLNNIFCLGDSKFGYFDYSSSKIGMLDIRAKCEVWSKIVERGVEVLSDGMSMFVQSSRVLSSLSLLTGEVVASSKEPGVVAIGKGWSVASIRKANVIEINEAEIEIPSSNSLRFAKRIGSKLLLNDWKGPLHVIDLPKAEMIDTWNPDDGCQFVDAVICGDLIVASSQVFKEPNVTRVGRRYLSGDRGVTKEIPCGGCHSLDPSGCAVVFGTREVFSTTSGAKKGYI